MRWCFALLFALCLLLSSGGGGGVRARSFTTSELLWQQLFEVPSGLPANANASDADADAAMVVPMMTTTADAAAAASPDDDNIVVLSAAGEHWSERAENPASAALSIGVTHFATLPRGGAVANHPWPGYYWPHCTDSINMRWAGSATMSPAAKYATFAGMPINAVEDPVSARYGIDSVAGKPCSIKAQCPVGTYCGRRNGRAEGKCIPTWFGICPGWAMASMMELEPRAPVSAAGVQFLPTDVKALLSLVYASMPTYMLGTKCRAEMVADAYGRMPPSCRDLNPGVLHLVLSNHVGLQHQPLAMDRDSSYEVWTQPIVGYTITSEGAISPPEANRMLGASGDGYVFNPAAIAWNHVQMDLEYQNEMFPTTEVPAKGSYTRHMLLDYVLELDGGGNVIGGEWVGASRRVHPDLFFHLHAAGEHVAVGGISLSRVRSLIRQ